MAQLMDPSILNAEMEKMQNELRTIFKNHVQKVGLISTQNFVPIDTGKLQASYKEEIISDTPDLFIIRQSYGNDGEVPYAAAVHEVPTNYHPHGSAGYLRIPISLTLDDLTFEFEQMVLL